MKTPREIIARSVCAEVNDVSFDALPEAATYLERKTYVARPFLDKAEARSSADAILAALTASGYRIVPAGRDPETVEACAKVADVVAEQLEQQYEESFGRELDFIRDRVAAGSKIARNFATAIRTMGGGE